MASIDSAKSLLPNLANLAIIEGRLALADAKNRITLDRD